MALDQLIPVINKLQEVLSTLGIDSIDLPQIVVVGSQSSGKSSVLENIVGRDFLPRGSGIVTRCPLVLQLLKISPPDSSASPEEWGEFLHKPSEKFSNFDHIREEIERETNRETGSNKGISPKPIFLKIYSPHVLNLTLVDLPGITRVPLPGQDPNIEQKIKQMILQFITNPKSIILAVTAANTDLSNSDALHIAKDVDPDGSRTIGVLTKIDIMDKGTDAVEMLQGKVIPLKLGFIGVINRSQQDINTKKPIRQAVQDEKAYFANHIKYRSVAHQCGTIHLSKTLNQILLYHIRDSLPDLKDKVNKMIQQTQLELSSYGDDVLTQSNSKGALLLNTLTKFTTDYRDAIEGKSTEVSLNELHGGARINYTFNELYTNQLNSIQATDGLSDTDIRTAIRNAYGPRSALFIPESSFELLVKRQILRLLDPSLNCVDRVYDELQRIITQLEIKELQRFAVLRDRLVEAVHELLNRLRKPTKTMINNLINIELSYINTNHPDFVGAVKTVFEKMSPQNQNQNQEGGQGRPQGQAPGSVGAPSGQAKPPLPKTPQPVPQSQPQRQQQPQGFRNDRLDQVPPTITTGVSGSEKEKFDTGLIKSLIVTYFNIVKKNILDSVPKAIMHFLVNASRENMQNDLISKLYKDELLDELLGESPEIAAKRKACVTLLDALRRVNSILNEIRDFNFSRNDSSSESSYSSPYSYSQF
jgi:dynamin 1-like protein